MDSFYCKHGETGHCFKCSAELRKHGIFVIKALDVATNERISQSPDLRTFKSEKAAANFCEKMNAKQTAKYYTFVVRPRPA